MFLRHSLCYMNNLNYWLCVTNEENWNIVKEKGIWGVPKKSKKQIESVKIGDQIVFYVIPKRISGIFEAISNAFESQDILFKWDEFGRNEIFPYRIKIKPVYVAKQPVMIDALVPKLQFIKHKVIYSVHLRKAIQEIPKEDFELIINALNKK